MQEVSYQKGQVMSELLTINWDFKKADTQYMTHGLHTYPARMIPQIASTLIKSFSEEEDLTLDPFCGSGTVLVESLLNNRHSQGADLNPLAVLLSKVKTTPLSLNILAPIWDKIKIRLREDFTKYNLRQYKPEIPELAENTNIEFWFKDCVIDSLAIIKTILDNELIGLDEEISNFFKICFSSTVRKVSNLRNGEYKIYRIPKNKLHAHNPDVYKVFTTIAATNLNKMEEFYNYYLDRIRKDITSEVIGPLDSRYLPKDRIKKSSVNLVVTSPPYGDSRTTVAYGQFSRYSLIWLGFGKEEVYKIDENLLGGKKIEDKPLSSKTARDILLRIGERDKKRELDTMYFFSDLNKTINEMHDVLTSDSYACIVIGDRAVRRIRVPTSEITKELGENAGFEHIMTIGRNIPTKANPTMSKFKIGENKFEWIKTMNKESIVILRKT